MLTIERLSKVGKKDSLHCMYAHRNMVEVNRHFKEGSGDLQGSKALKSRLAHLKLGASTTRTLEAA